MVSEGFFELSDFSLQSGEVLKGARVAWQSFGTLAPAKDNVILYPTCYAATHDEQVWAVGPGGMLDTDRYFVVIVDMFGNGLSSSPSNDASYPGLVTVADNVRAQRRLLAEAFGVEKLACVYGFSMGGQQAYHWAALYPDAVERAIVVCGSAKTSPHNQVFLEGLLAVLEAAPEYVGEGRFSAVPHKAMRAFARVYAGWCMSQDFFRAGLHLLTASSLEDFLDREWEPDFTRRNAENLHAQAKAWLHADISANDIYGGDLAKALSAITARVLLMPSATDLYFRTADNEAELPFLRNAALAEIPTIWGHAAGAPAGLETERAFMRERVAGWLGDDAGVVDRLVALGEEGMASGVDETFDIDAFVRDV
jgi:homoserine O-acetyltransferase